MDSMNVQQKEVTASLVSEKPERLSFGETLVLYSQYIVIVLLVIGALALRLIFGEP